MLVSIASSKIVFALSPARRPLHTVRHVRTIPTEKSIHPSISTLVLPCLPNVLPFSGERRTDARSYHGREEPRAPARGVAARPAFERAAQAFIRCNGLLDRATNAHWFSSEAPSRLHPVPLRLPGCVRRTSKGPRRTQRMNPLHRARRASPISPRHDDDERRCRPLRFDPVATSRWLPFARIFRRSLSNDLAFSGGAQAPSAATRGWTAPPGAASLMDKPETSLEPVRRLRLEICGCPAGRSRALPRGSRPAARVRILQ